ncbi:MAG: nucleotidyltransferase domain-containing protein [Deltaproteobacteria bacterium]|nr:nucleotidyltransferase domain-containing protein [Deltaproteobacteria bacterium]
MALSFETITTIIKNYAQDVRQKTPIEKVVLYGSYAEGLVIYDSDIDVYFFLTSFSSEHRYNIMVRLIEIAHQYNLYIDIIAFKVFSIYNNHFIKKVLRTGIEFN